jgi:GDP-L-fucose synthase
VKILVTGAGGMVGHNLLADPRASEHRVLAPPRGLLNLTDAGACRLYFKAHRPDLVIHLAGVVGGIAANAAAPATFLARNLAIGLNVLQAADGVGVERLLNLGSSCMYPALAPSPLTEDQLLTGALEATNEGYALAKLTIWKLAQAMDQEGRAWRTLIPPNLYGPHDTFDPDRSHLIAAAILKTDSAMAQGRSAVEIWGDGTARREFLFAADLADFIWRHVDRLEVLPATMNVGVGEDLAVDDYYRAVASALGFEGGFTHNRARPTGVARKLLDIGAQARLGWRPLTPLGAGLDQTIDFYRRRTRPRP